MGITCSISRFSIMLKFVVLALAITSVAALKKLGCWKDTGKRAIPTIEGKDALLDGKDYRKRKDALNKCAAATLKRGFTTFAVQHGGWCATSATAGTTYKKYGPSKTCAKDGEGGPWGNEVYQLEAVKLGCWKDTGKRAIPTIEGKDALLDGKDYRKRKNAFAKCKAAALKRGNRVFALQHGGWCATSKTAEKTYKKYGKSKTCAKDGEGGPWGNEVYRIQ